MYTENILEIMLKNQGKNFTIKDMMKCLSDEMNKPLPEIKYGTVKNNMIRLAAKRDDIRMEELGEGRRKIMIFYSEKGK